MAELAPAAAIEAREALREEPPAEPVEPTEQPPILSPPPQMPLPGGLHQSGPVRDFRDPSRSHRAVRPTGAQPAVPGIVPPRDLTAPDRGSRKLEDTQALIASVTEELTEGEPEEPAAGERTQPDSKDGFGDEATMTSSRRGVQLGLAAAAAAVLVIGASLLFVGSDDLDEPRVAHQEDARDELGRAENPEAPPAARRSSERPPDPRALAVARDEGADQPEAPPQGADGPEAPQPEPDPESISATSAGGEHEAQGGLEVPSKEAKRVPAASSSTATRRPPPPPPPPEKPPESDPSQAPARPARPMPPAPQDPKDLLRAAIQANKNGKPDQGYRLASQSYRQTRSSDAAEVMAQSACMMRNRPKAEAALKNVRVLRRLHVRSSCRSVGLTL